MMLQKHMGKAVSRIVKDFKQKELMPLKILFFVQATTFAVLYPYLTIHMRELGISIEETAIMSAMIPVIGIIMPPLAGMIADKIGNFKLLLAFSSLIGGATTLLLLIVPPASVKVVHPHRLMLDFGCDSDPGMMNIRLSSNVPCERMPVGNASAELELKLDTCGLACRASNKTLSTIPNTLQDEESTSDLILKARTYSFKYESNTGTRSNLYDLTKTGEEIQRVSDGDLFFFPTQGSYKLKCEKLPSNVPGYSCHIGGGEADAIGNDTFVNSRVSPEEWYRDRNLILHHHDNTTLPHFETSTCSDSEASVKEVVTVSVYLNDKMTDAIELTKCEARCLATTERKNVCSNAEVEIIKDPQLTFWAYLIVRVLISVTGSTTYSMFEVAVISILREQKADYGLQRIYASIGGMAASPLSGFLIDYASRGKIGTDYSPAFYLYAALKLLSCLLMLLINLEFKQAAKSVVSDFLQVLKNSEVLCLLASCFILGSAWGYIESFLFWFLEDLGGNRSLMGITVTVGGLAGIPLLIFSGPIIDKIGHANVIFIGFIFYAIRLLGYSLIHNPYHCLFFEAMESITSSLAITAAITYAARLSTTTTDGSIQGLVGGLYYGVGKGAGTLVGGYLMKSYGTRQTFQIFSTFTISTGIIYFLINHCYIRKLPNRENNEICKKEPKKPKIQDDVKVITEKASKDTRDGEKGASNEPEKVQSQQQHENDGYVKTEAEEKPTGDKSEHAQTATTKED